MKITGLELFRISVPFATPYKLSKVYGTIHNAQAVILKLHTGDGLTGLGEADPMPPFTDESPAGVMAALGEHIGPRLIGQDPFKLSVLEDEMDRIMRGNPTAKGAVSMALYDLVGQARGVPVHALLGGRRVEELPILWGTGSGSPEEDIEVIEEYLALGFSSYMLKMGALPIDHEIGRVKKVERRFGTDIRLVVDANQGWSVFEALEFVTGAAEVRLEMIEQPLPRNDLAGLNRIRSRCRWPLSADEGLVTPEDALRLIQERLVDIFSIKISKNGGLTAARKLAELAGMAGLKVFMNSMLEFGVTQAASLHLGSTLNNLVDIGHAYGSPLRLSDDVTDYSDLVADGRVKVPDEPGLGVSIDDARLKKYTVDYLKI